MESDVRPAWKFPKGDAAGVSASVVKRAELSEERQ
jgi:hypothetical protein